MQPRHDFRIARFSTFATILCIVAATGPLRAQSSPEDKALATVLFKEARP